MKTYFEINHIFSSVVPYCDVHPHVTDYRNIKQLVWNLVLDCWILICGHCFCQFGYFVVTFSLLLGLLLMLGDKELFW